MMGCLNFLVSGAHFSKVRVTFFALKSNSNSNQNLQSKNAGPSLQTSLSIVVRQLIHVGLSYYLPNCCNLKLEYKQQQLSWPLNYHDFQEIMGPRAFQLPTNKSIALQCQNNFKIIS